MTNDKSADLVSRAAVIIHAAMCKMVPVERHPGDSAIVRKWAREAATEIRSALTTEAGDGWRDMADAPKDGAWILAGHNLWGGDSVIVGWHFGRWREDPTPEGPVYHPTHWQPLPPAPPATEGDA